MNFEDLKGKTLVGAEQRGSDEIVFTTYDHLTQKTDQYKLYHEQDCCEHVEVEDVAGDLSKLTGVVLLAEESSNNDEPRRGKYDDSHTWTFYRISTINQSVVIRWYGSSNGYYSESVSFARIGGAR